MNTTASEGTAFAIWVTGLPASGKSTVTRALVAELARVRVRVVVLESDEIRKILTPDPDYSVEERDFFYTALVGLTGLLVNQGTSVIVDATANKRVYREAARREIDRFLEVFVDCPLETCMERDPKGIYEKARQGLADSVPGLQVPYENGKQAELTVSGVDESPARGARRIVAALEAHHYLVGSV